MGTQASDINILLLNTLTTNLKELVYKLGHSQSSCLKSSLHTVRICIIKHILCQIFSLSTVHSNYLQHLSFQQSSCRFSLFVAFCKIFNITIGVHCKKIFLKFLFVDCYKTECLKKVRGPPFFFQNFYLNHRQRLL